MFSACARILCKKFHINFSQKHRDLSLRVFYIMLIHII